MNLKIILPSRVFAQKADVLSVVAQTPSGLFGLLPQRQDCVAALSPGILTIRTAAGEEFVAVDEGVLTKTGADVLVSVRHAIGGTKLGGLRASVENEFLKLDEQQRQMRSVLAKLEGSFIARFVKYNHA